MQSWYQEITVPVTSNCVNCQEFQPDSWTKVILLLTIWHIVIKRGMFADIYMVMCIYGNVYTNRLSPFCGCYQPLLLAKSQTSNVDTKCGWNCMTKFSVSFTSIMCRYCKGCKQENTTLYAKLASYKHDWSVCLVHSIDKARNLLLWEQQFQAVWM